MSRNKNNRRSAANAQPKKPAKQGAESLVNSRRTSAALREQANPLSIFGPEYLQQVLAEQRRGILKRAAVLWDILESDDDMIGTVASKRKGAVARLDWEIKTVEDSPEAKRQAEVLRDFYNSIVATDVLRQDRRGGLPLLIKQMADALSKGYAVHEIVWQWTPDGYTAECRFCPLWFFEATTAKLRYLPNSSAMEGVPMEDGNWLVTVSEPLMRACSILYLFKRLPLGDWLVYCGLQGLPAVIGETNAEPDSPEWDDFGEALAEFRNDLAAIVSTGNKINIHDVGLKGTAPWEPLVNYANRGITVRWRGADLSTLSQKDNTGASLQQSESDILLEDDADMISDALQQRLSRPLLQYTFGADVTPLAYIELQVPDRLDDNAKLALVKGSQVVGLPVSAQWTRESLGVPAPQSDEDTLVPPAPHAALDLLAPARAGANASDTLAEADRLAASAAVASDMQPLREQLARLEALAATDALTPEYLQQALDALPGLAEALLAAEGLEDAFISSMTRAAADGVVRAAQLRPPVA